VLACLGDAERRADTLRALTSHRDEDIRIAQVFLRHRPVDEPRELREIASGIGRMRDAETQVRALNALAGHRLSDPLTLEALARLFPAAESVGVQSAIAGVLIRANYHVLERGELLQTLTQHRLRSGGSENLVDVLIRRLRQAP
jgi:DNA-binding response OmpR family regulator